MEIANRVVIPLQRLQLDYTIGAAARNLYHVPVLRTSLTRNLASLSVDIHDEISQAFNDLIPVTDGKPQVVLYCQGTHTLSHCIVEWTPVPAVDTIMKIVARASGRVFVGLPFCMCMLLGALFLTKALTGRDPEYQDIILHATTEIVRAGVLLGLVPRPFRRSVSDNFQSRGASERVPNTF